MLLRKTLSVISMFLLLIPLFCSPVYAVESDAITVSAKSAILIDQKSGTVLYEKNADEAMPPASITKIMTMLLTMEALQNGSLSLTDPVTGSENAASMGGTQIWLEVGETFTVDEMLKACAIASANDASMALAEHIGGNEGAFVAMMNQKAAALGMKNTVFQNPTGLDADGHLSTARDIAIMSKELLAYPQITNYTTVWMDSLRDGAMELVNTNKLVRFYQGCTGLKTGTTDGAGSCLSASAERNGLSLIAVVMGCKTSKERFADARALLDYGFAAYEQYTPVLPEDIPEKLAVTGGMELWVDIDAKLPQSILMTKGSSAQIEVQTLLNDTVTAPIFTGDVLGEIVYRDKNEVLCRVPLLAQSDIKELNFKNTWKALLAALFA